MPALVNHTPFAVKTFGMLDQNARLHDVVVVSATFEAPPGRPLRLADEQVPVRDTDEYYGEPGVSSVRYEGEIAWEKPRVDVLVNGKAYGPGGAKTGSVAVGLLLGDVHKELRVTGDRRSRLGFHSAPEPFETMPIIYERALGGIDKRSLNPTKHPSDPRNPIGVGFHGALSQNPSIVTEVPNVEHVSKAPPPAGFGVVGRNWQPRIGLAGTYDQAWLAEQCPLLPLDFDTRHFQAAPLDQQSDTIRGGEQGEIRNMTPEGIWRFLLPTLKVPVHPWYGNRKRQVELKLDAVIIEPDSYRIILIARANILVRRNQAPLEEIVLGHVTPGWERARRRNKIYLDRTGRKGKQITAKVVQS
jgi:hypothetical protein